MTERISTRLAARLWWALLPYAGIWGYRDEDAPAENVRWWWRFTFVAYYAWKLVGRLPGSDPFEPMAQIVCTCDFCKGVPGAVFEP